MSKAFTAHPSVLRSVISGRIGGQRALVYSFLFKNKVMNKVMDLLLTVQYIDMKQ